MPSTPHLIHHEAGLLVVAVDHNDGTSFSRSVDPTATRVWNKSQHLAVTPANQHADWHRRGLYADDYLTPTTPGRTCRSLIVFTANPNPDRVLADWHTRLREESK